MNEQIINECVKAFSLGYGAKTVAEARCLTRQKAKKIYKDNQKEILLRKEKLIRRNVKVYEN